MDADSLADILEYAEELAPLLDELTIRKKVDVLSRLESDTAAGYLKSLDKLQRNTLLDLMDDHIRQEIALLQPYGGDEGGSIMTTNYIAVTPGLSIVEAQEELVRQAAEHDNIATIYVVDEHCVFCGAMDLKALIVARESEELASVMTTSYPYLYADEQIADCLPRIRSYSEDSIPVLDHQSRLLGVITAQHFLQVMNDEMGEDYAKLAGLSEESGRNESVRDSVRKRLPWLMILLGLGIGVSAVVGIFENLVAQLTIIVCFQSLILDMAGNVGTQSLAVTIRILMDSTLTGRQTLSLIWKEVRVGFTNGAILGGASFLTIGLYMCLAKGSSIYFSFAVSACSGITLLLAMTLAAFAGTAVPVLFRKMGIDPGVASGPLITTVNDLTAILSYYGLAWLFLIRLLHLAG